MPSGEGRAVACTDANRGEQRRQNSMSTDIDIVCRLRERAQYASGMGRLIDVIDCSDGASEIERLRSKIAQLSQTIENLESALGADQ